jgi:radical SAM protein with 4Fe4S-binding SPASM domain
VVVEALTTCNLACPFCAHDRRLPGARRALAPEALAAFLSLLAGETRASGARTLVSWLGGEPFLARWLVALTESFAKEGGLRFSATTNGTRLADADLRDHLRRCYDELTVSVDAIGAGHDRLRGRRGLYAALGEQVRRLADEAPALRLRANVVLMRDTVEGFPDLCHELAAWGIREITFNALGGRDRPEFHPANHLLAGQVDQLLGRLGELQATLAGGGVHLACSDAYRRRLRATAAGRSLPVQDCGPGERYLFVSASGRVAPCAFTTEEYGVAIGALASAEDIAALPLRFRAARAAARAAACADCPCTNVHGKFD